MQDINLNRLAYFAAVVDAGSFTRAADRLGITKAVVSQQVARLEDDLKTTLLLRSTRRVEPTEAGRQLHARCVMILREAEDAFDELAQGNVEPRGILRIAAPNDYGTATIAPLAATFSRRYPQCSVELLLADSQIDLVANQVDLSIRVGWLTDSSLQARRVGSFQQFLVAAPDMGITITDPDGLVGLPFIANHALRDPLVWRFSRNDIEHRTVRMRQAMAINTTPAVLAATLAGAGLAVLPDFLVADHLRAGTLQRIAPDWSLPSGGIHVVYPAARYRPSKVSAFVNMLVDSRKTLAHG
ncbi:LysR substrate-binding domain-containing protein (plasmid) [Agrobacterium leguminum]|uniref:LysR family transcriptional regulator n=1 Tax=Agrobacterium leguminum TaxID=2792015 RepID=UPI00272BF866|nr:LysR family transcriptional regulator [Agrobacterium leguminum]WLE00604.1 LysR substrate-binding domain-containing protein [Agrobacterium leguminum]